MITVRDRYHEQTSVSKAADPVRLNGLAWNDKGSTVLGSLSFLQVMEFPTGSALTQLLVSKPLSNSKLFTLLRGGGGRPLSFVGEFGTNGSALGCMYYAARGEILRPVSDTRQRRLSAGATPSVKNESVGSKDDQIPL